MLSSTYLYRTFVHVAGFARGMVLLFGPLFYLYTCAILKPGFVFRGRHLLHFLPYLVAFVLIRIQEGSVPSEIRIAAIDALMEGRSVMNFVATLWFVAYFIHLLVYIVLTYVEMRTARNDPGGMYIIPLEQRVAWLKRITAAFILLATVFAGITGYILLTGIYSITGNFIYTIALAVIVYLIAWQAMIRNELLFPDFVRKYKSGLFNEQLIENIISKLQQLFEHEKVFVDPELTLSGVAQKLDTQPHIVSQVINDRFRKSFNELLNQYRVEEFNRRARDPKYAAYSIIGIAQEVGYNSKSSFYAAFRKIHGTTPSEYMKSGS